MFDFIKCEYPLPLPEEAKELKNSPVWSEIEFQTKNLRGLLEIYTIEEDGQFYRELLKRELVNSENGFTEILEQESGIEKQELTGEVFFHTLHMEEDYDYFISFLALFWKGELKELTLGEWKREDNKERLENEKKFNQAINCKLHREKKWWHKPYNLYKSLVSLFFYIIKYILGCFIKLCWKIERWIT